MRESPSLELIHVLKEHHAEVHYYDPFIPVIPETREHPEFAGMASIDWSEEKLKTFDAAIIATDHTKVDYELLCRTLPLVIDTRNAAANVSKTNAANIVKA